MPLNNRNLASVPLEAEKRTHARKLNMARRQLNQEQRRELIREQLLETPEKSDRQIAAGLGVSQPTVSKIRTNMENSGELIKVISSIGADGKERPRQVERKPKPESEVVPAQESPVQEEPPVSELEEPPELPANAIPFPEIEPTEETEEEPTPTQEPEERRCGPMTPLRAIRARCLDCCGGSYTEVRLCPCQDCPLYAYRMGRRPPQNDELRESKVNTHPE